jgi:hypothetical protein
MSNGVKPRYDGAGTEFGLRHRDLGPGFLMMDIDRLHAAIDIDVKLQRENEMFIEYRSVNGISYLAMYELKHARTFHSEKALDMELLANQVRFDICKRLDCRCFVVFATNGKQPFSFYELFEDRSDHVGVLEYSEGNAAEAWKAFYRDVLKIGRYGNL